ncbi:MAG: flagellar assembly protein FliH [Burkholderiales bacterium]|nr:flagellar assembly protein FliH [Burkholderiales bacterium]
MSSSKIIPKASAGAAKAWQPGSVDRRAATGTATPELTPQQKFQAELERLRGEARAEGRREGLEQGFAAAKVEVEELRLLLTNLRELMLDFEQGVASDVLSLALEVAKQMVRQSIRVKPELVFAIIKEAAMSFPEIADDPRLILHPLDAELVRKAIAPTLTADELPWKLTEDPQMERGGCRFQTGSSEIDATLENRWRRIVAALGRDDAWLDLNI